MGWTPPSWATPEMVAAAEADQARMDEDADKLVSLAQLMAGDDERLLGQLSRALTKAYFLGRRAEWDVGRGGSLSDQLRERGIWPVQSAAQCGASHLGGQRGGYTCILSADHTGEHSAAGVSWPRG